MAVSRSDLIVSRLAHGHRDRPDSNKKGPYLAIRAFFAEGKINYLILPSL